jgi:hypothetical protein
MGLRVSVWLGWRFSLGSDEIGKVLVYEICQQEPVASRLLPVKPDNTTDVFVGHSVDESLTVRMDAAELNGFKELA